MRGSRPTTATPAGGPTQRAPYTEALAIYRDLAQRVPDAYRPEVARDAEQSCKPHIATPAGWPSPVLAILRVPRDLPPSRVQRVPVAYRPVVATMLNNLGRFSRVTGRLADAETSYTEALAFRRDLAQRDPGAYGSYNRRFGFVHEIGIRSIDRRFQLSARKVSEGERWPGKTEQADKWIPCLTAARMPRNRRGTCRDVHGATTARPSRRR